MRLYICMYTYIHTCLRMHSYIYIWIHVCMHTEESFSQINSLSLSLSLFHTFSLSLPPTLFHVKESLTCPSLCLERQWEGDWLTVFFWSLSLPPPLYSRHKTISTRVTNTAQMCIMRTINGARNPHLAWGVGSSRRVNICHFWPTMCAPATGIFGHTCWPNLRASVPALSASFASWLHVF